MLLQASNVPRWCFSLGELHRVSFAVLMLSHFSFSPQSFSHTAAAHLPSSRAGRTTTLVSAWAQWWNPSAELIFACPTQYTIYKTESSLTAQCVTTLALLEGRKCSHYITWHLHIFNKQRKSHLPFQEVDRVNNIPAILAQVLLKLLQDISNSGSIVQMNF